MDLHAVDRGPDDNKYLVSPKAAWFAFAMTIALMIFDYVDRQIIVSLFPHLKAEWGLSDKQLAGLVSIVSITVAVGGIPIALIADRFSRVKSIVVMATAWSLATISCMFVRSYPALFAARAVVGAGEAGYGSVGAGLIASHFPARMRGTLMAGFFAAASFGSVLGVLLGGVIADRWGWKADRGRADEDLADFARRQVAARGVDDAQLHQGHRRAAGLEPVLAVELVLVGAQQRHRAHGFGGAVPLHEAAVHLAHGLPDQRQRDRRAGVHHQLEATEVRAGGFRVVQQHLQRRRHDQHDARPQAAHRLEHGGGLEGIEHRNRAAVVQALQHQPRAGGVEIRHEHQVDVVRRPADAGIEVFGQADEVEVLVAQLHALGQAGGARGRSARAARRSRD